MYLIRKGHNPKVAHIFNGNDTICRMYSTGGMNKSKFKQVIDTSLPICINCQNKISGSLGKNPARFRKFSEKEVNLAIKNHSPKIFLADKPTAYAFVTSDAVWHAIMSKHGAMLKAVKTSITDGQEEVVYGVAGAEHPLLMLRETWNAETDPERKAILVEYWLYISVPA